MKKLLIFISVLALAACSSSPKEEEAPMEQPTAEAQATPEASTPAPEDNSASMTADMGENMEGGFPDVEGTERSGATCKNGSDERLVSVIDTKEGPCGVVYTKHGTKKTVAYAKHVMPFCDNVYNNIIGNLTAGGFDCGGAGAAASSSQPEEKQEESNEAGEAEEGNE